MRLYLFLDRLFPNSFPAKVFFVAFIGTHIPLITVVSWVLSWNTGLSLLHPVIGVLLVATLSGTVVTLWAVWALLAPLRLLRGALDDFDATGRLDETLPSGRDDVGRLTRTAIRMARRLSARMSHHVSAAETDPLTGLLNRRGLEARADAITRGTVLFLDLDGFKQVNDTLGHDVGDRVLAATGHVLKSETRAQDLLARPGGDEFIVIAPDLTVEEAQAIGERLRRAVAEIMDDDRASVSASIGIAAIDRDWRWSVERADRAMFEGKAQGRDRVAVFRDPVRVRSAPETSEAAGEPAQTRLGSRG